uniref:Conserved hypothetical plastid protein n=1 Tax=Olisthodiscus luteus TaxID=83000 RepID=A0A7U0QGM0_OLILU|nr:conserved hypothetical plastid protein [Olisthodiscus luteus]QQW50528.1 conserved hypothetical plastid protein [Olisthodiscus luteus]
MLMLPSSDLQKLIHIFPDHIKKAIEIHPELNKIIEIIIDLGRKPELRFLRKNEYISQQIISWQDIDYLVKQIGKFADDNRAGINETLHRISCIKNKKGIIIGVTCRVGKFIIGTVSLIEDLIHKEQSLLLLGKPGVGKTTAIREMARVFSDELYKRVVIVDTSNEIAGDSDIPHIGIGRARRLQVFQSNFQHKVMIEAVENHMPEIIVVDEIGTELEAYAARTIAERGVQLIGTAHGNSLENLIKNPALSELVGGIEVVTLSDNEAKRRGTQKSILERKGLSAFKIAIEMNSLMNWQIHVNVEESVDLILLRQTPFLEFRKINLAKKVYICYRGSELFFNFQTQNKQILPIRKLSSFLKRFENKHNPIEIYRKLIILQIFYSHRIFLPIKFFTLFGKKLFHIFKKDKKNLVIFCYCLPQEKVKKIFNKMQLKFIFTQQIEQADFVISQKYHITKTRKFYNLILKKKIPTLLVKNHQLESILVKLINFVNM